MAPRPTMAGSALAVGGSSSCVSLLALCLEDPNRNRLEQAVEPEQLAQETIISNLSSEEAQRLSKVRNIGSSWPLS